MSSFIPHYDPVVFDKVMTKVRSFFKSKGFVECYSQNRLSIMSSCEDPKNLATMSYIGQVWPLPQTGQMWLEYELLKNPKLPGLFSLGTSYRNEPNPKPGRHSLAFGMIEFEIPGDMEDLIKLETELLEYLGFPMTSGSYPRDTYDNVAKKYNVEELEHEHEDQLCKDHGPVFFLTDFPEHTSPFWNMKRDPESGISKKVDVILCGQETFGSAERSCDTDDMRNRFKSISNGEYAGMLYSQFTKDRVVKELEDFLDLKFFTRSGGGIGLDRLIRAMKECNLLDQ